MHKKKGTNLGFNLSRINNLILVCDIQTLYENSPVIKLLMRVCRVIELPDVDIFH